MPTQQLVSQRGTACFVKLDTCRSEEEAVAVFFAIVAFMVFLASTAFITLVWRTSCS